MNDLKNFIKDQRARAEKIGFVKTIHGMTRDIGVIRENDRVRIIDPKHEEFDEKGYVTSITFARYYVVLDNTMVASLNRAQIQKEST